MPHGQIAHIDLPSDDLARAKAFYTELFGWEIGQMPEFPDYELFRAGPGEIGGGIGLRSQVPGMGWSAAITDAEGSQIGIWENSPG